MFNNSSACSLAPPSIRKHSLSFLSSGGCGRTGTFIAVDILLERLKTEGVVDVFSIVRRIRLQRPGMVQSVVSFTCNVFSIVPEITSFVPRLHSATFKWRPGNEAIYEITVLILLIVEEDRGLHG